MTTQLASSAELPGTPAQVVALRTSAAWVERKAERFGDASAVVARAERPDGGAEISVSRELPSGVPGFLQRFLPKDATVVQRESWDPPDAQGTCRGTWSAELPGAPAQLHGTCTLESSGTGTRQMIVGTAKVSVPLVGGKAEQFVVEMTEKLMAKEAELMAEMLPT
jgi:hypothetical protein